MGYKNIILTIYRMNVREAELYWFADKNKPFAITMPWKYADSSTASSKINSLGVKVYVHTLNDVEQFFDLQNKGVYGVYTDFLIPEMLDGK